MDGEVQANLSFSDLKLGDRVKVDIHDPKVAALVKAGYLKIIWREPDAAMAHSAGPGPGPRSDLGAGDPAEEEVDGDGQDSAAP